MPSAACMVTVARPAGRGRIVRASTLHWPVGAVHQAAAPDADCQPAARGRPVMSDTRGAAR